mgnify:CR=1 FL=1
MYLVYPYVEDGYAAHGEKIPDIPVVYLTLKVSRFTARGPAIIDTGFDGGLYPNIKVVRILKGMRPAAVKRLEHPLWGFVECEVYRVRASIASPDFTNVAPLGEVNVYTPTEPEFLSEEVLVGREILNKLRVRLDGWWVQIEL